MLRSSAVFKVSPGSISIRAAVMVNHNRAHCESGKSHGQAQG
jgi:hypothetical protein